MSAGQSSRLWCGRCALRVPPHLCIVATLTHDFDLPAGHKNLCQLSYHLFCGAVAALCASVPFGFCSYASTCNIVRVFCCLAGSLAGWLSTSLDCWMDCWIAAGGLDGLLFFNDLAPACDRTQNKNIPLSFCGLALNRFLIVQWL